MWQYFLRGKLSKYYRGVQGLVKNFSEQWRRVEKVIENN